MSALALCPVTFADACDFVALHHRHHEPPIGHKFSIGVALDDALVGVAMVGRPVARFLDDGNTLEKTIHRQFAHSLVAGREWFAPDATLRDHVAKVREQFGDPKDHAHHHRKRSRSGGPSVSSFGVKW